jgi:hypothetical protein
MFAGDCKVVLRWFPSVVALLSAIPTGELVETRLGAFTPVRQGIQALIIPGLVIPGIIILRRAGNKEPVRGLGLTGSG